MRIVPAELEGLPALYSYALLAQKGKYFNVSSWQVNYRTDQGNMTRATNDVRALPFYLPRAIKIDRMCINIGLANSNSFQWFAVYRPEPTGHRYPGGLVHDFGQVEITATGESAGTAGTPKVLGPGLLWFALFYKTGAGYSYPKVTSQGRPRINTYGYEATSGYANTHYGITGTTTYPTSAPPDPFPAGMTWARSNFPGMFFRVAS